MTKPVQPQPAKKKARFKLPNLAPKQMNFYSKAGMPAQKKEKSK